jgi:hypothetical protein
MVSPPNQEFKPVFRKVIAAAALALSLGVATVPAFAADVDDSLICQNGANSLARLPSIDYRAVGRAAEAQFARLHEAEHALGAMANNHYLAIVRGDSMIDPNDPSDMPCAEAVKLLIDYVEGK